MADSTAKKKKFFTSRFILRFTSVHSWVGICTGMFLFIAFFAGALTMYERAANRWANPQVQQARGSLAELNRVVSATGADPATGGSFDLRLPEQGRGPLASYYVDGPDRSYKMYMAALGEDGKFEARETPSSVSHFVNEIHFTAGLPGDAGYTLMGIVSAIYGLALISGLLIHLPHLVKDLFSLRTGRNLKKMWLDAHNVIGVLSLPFHLVFALTGLWLCIIYVFPPMMNAVSPRSDAYEAFAADEAGSYLSERRDDERQNDPPPARMLPASQLLKIAQGELGGLRMQTMSFSGYGTRDATVTVSGQIDGALVSHAAVDLSAVTGKVEKIDAPGRRGTTRMIDGSYTALHYGDFGGEALRAIYFVLGLAGAFLFYSGNLLWIETRRKHRYIEQPRNGWVMAQVTVGVCLGACVGIGAALLAAQVPPWWGATQDAWEKNLYYLGFFVVMTWSLARPPVRAAYEILFSAAVLYAALPVAQLLRSGGNGDWQVWLYNAILLMLAASFAALGWATVKRGRNGQPNSVWSLTGAPMARARPSKQAEGAMA